MYRVRVEAEFESFIEFIGKYIFKSSANNRYLQDLNIRPTSFINSRNNRGDKWPHWGTPEIATLLLDKTPTTMTLKDLLDKYEENHDNNGSLIPSFFNFNINIPWSTKSKAFLRSV